MDDPNLTDGLTFEEMADAYLRAEQEAHDLAVRKVEALLASGIAIEINPYADRPVAILPKRYEAALKEVQAGRDNRDAAENFYRDILWGNLPMPGWPHTDEDFR